MSEPAKKQSQISRFFAKSANAQLPTGLAPAVASTSISTEASEKGKWALSRLTSADADEDAGNGGTTRSSQLTPAPSAEKPTVNALDEIAALVDD